MPEINQQFEIDQPPEMVWRFFQDVARVVTCMPGLEYGGTAEREFGAETHLGKVRIKLGPVTAAFEGEATIMETDAADRSACIKSKGVDKRGGSRASASVFYKIEDNGSGSRVRIDADIKLSGALAQMGRTGIVQDVTAQITEQFADSLRATLAAETASTTRNGSKGKTSPMPAPREIRGESLLLKLIWRRVLALLGLNRG